MGECLQCSLSDSTCQAGGWDEETQTADTQNYPVNEDGVCEANGDPYPGDSCESFQTNWGAEWCPRSGDLKVDCDCEECFTIEECPICGEDSAECDCEEEENE
jgi:hypothetical protein